MTQMNKREFLKAAAAVAVSIAVRRSPGAEPQPIPKTYIYKTAGGCQVKADVYGSDATLRKPAILWIHGGALIFGSRESPPQWLNPDGRYIVVSIDYRLAPETERWRLLLRISRMLTDGCARKAREVFAWIQREWLSPVSRGRVFNVDDGILGWTQSPGRFSLYRGTETSLCLGIAGPIPSIYGNRWYQKKRLINP